MERKKWNCNSKGDYENYEIKREELETIVKKLKNGKVSGVDNVTFELYKHAYKSLKKVT
jgi:exonuclease VII small subunit